MDGEQLQKKKDQIRAEYRFKLEHYNQAADDGMPGANGNTEDFRRTCRDEAHKAGAEIGLSPAEVDALIGEGPTPSS